MFMGFTTALIVLVIMIVFKIVCIPIDRWANSPDEPKKK